MKKIEPEFKTDIFVLRLTKDEQERYKRIVETALGRNRLARSSDINRELLGMDDYGLLTAQEKAYFRGQAEAPRRLKANEPEEEIGNDSNATAAKKRKT